MKKLILLASAAGMLAATGAAAAEAQRGPGHHGQAMRAHSLGMFLRAAADENGQVTRASFDALRGEVFDWMDRNGDGYLDYQDRSPVHLRLRARYEAMSEEERAERREAMQARMQEWRERREAASEDGDRPRRGMRRGPRAEGAEGDARRQRWAERRESGEPVRISRAAFIEAGGQIFERLDANDDGVISREEAQAAFAGARERRGRGHRGGPRR